MYPIVRKEKLADNIILMDIKAPRVAKECLPGQFIIAKTDEVGERIPLTICDYDREKETVTIVVQTIGAGTERMMALNEGDSLEDFVGPLGCPSELCQEDNLEETKKSTSYLSQEVLVQLLYIHRLSGLKSMVWMLMSSWDLEIRISFSLRMR